MADKDYLKLGDNNVLCDVCGFKFKASQVKERWDGLIVCSKDFETRHSLDFIRPKTEKVTPKVVSSDDQEGRITPATTNQSPAAQATGNFLTHFNTTSGALLCTLPAANHANFKGISVSYHLIITSGSNNVTVSSASAIQGSTTVVPDIRGIYRNIPSNNLWIRDA